MRLLVVEDDDGIAAPLVSGLRREGFEVERVATGAAALAAGEPDLVLLDLRLPDLSGLTVLVPNQRTTRPLRSCSGTTLARNHL